MPEVGIVPLSGTTCLVGHDGWGEGRLGDYRGSDVRLTNFRFIGEFDGFHGDPEGRLVKMHALGDEAAEHLRGVLPGALEVFRHVIVRTHVPPFREACRHDGGISDDNRLPFFACKALGIRHARQWTLHPTGG